MRCRQDVERLEPPPERKGVLDRSASPYRPSISGGGSTILREVGTHATAHGPAMNEAVAVLRAVELALGAADHAHAVF